MQSSNSDALRLRISIGTSPRKRGLAQQFSGPLIFFFFIGDSSNADNLPALRHSLAEQQWQERTVLIRKEGVG